MNIACFGYSDLFDDIDRISGYNISKLVLNIESTNRIHYLERIKRTGRQIEVIDINDFYYTNEKCINCIHGNDFSWFYWYIWCIFFGWYHSRWCKI